MSIRTRMTLWYSGVMFVCLIAMGALTYHEFSTGPGKPVVQIEDPVTDREDDLRDVLRILLWCSVPAGVLALGGGWMLMRKAFAPLTTLTRAVETINERNLNEQLPLSGKGDEFDRLTEVFNAMTARLNDSFTRIREFTLHASHELKTPLTVMCGETEIALRDEALPPAQRERANSQLEELRRLAAIVDGLTLLAKADAGLIPLALTPVRLDDLVRDNFADAQILAHASGLRVELTKCESLTVAGDAHRLRQLLLNLADNAVKYNQPQGSIHLALRRVNGTAEFTIRNSGPGIATEAVPRVFDRFYRGDLAHSHTVEGCGLGLSIAKWIVSAHNGTIQIESTPARQTIVTVNLPVASTA